jgi:multiple sugar transport system substrate-binding protein
MKYLFLLCLVLLVAATVVTERFEPAGPGKIPIIYWLTDPNPARTDQVNSFKEWMKRVHPGIDCDLIVDSANDDPTKSVIQAVSGVGDDIMDQGGGGMRYFQAIGAVRDLGRVSDMNSLARRMGFGPDKTYPAVTPEISIPAPDGSLHQYSFPCNVNAPMMFLNKNTFLRYGLEPPPMQWSLDDFEKLGLKLNKIANPDQSHRTVFIAPALDLTVLRRTLGGNNYNETDTRCTVDSPAGIEALAKLYRYTNVDHILPNTAEQNSQATQSGYGGSTAQLFNDDDFGMWFTGRYLLIQFRKFDADRKAEGKPLLNLGVSEMPNGGFPTTVLGARAATVYMAGKHSSEDSDQLALYFMQYLTSRDYNMLIVNDADSLPPNPEYVNDPEFLDPKDHPNEKGVSKAFSDAAYNLAIASSYSPFVLDTIFLLNDTAMRDLCLNDQLTPAQAAQREAERVNDEIQRSLTANPSLQPWYDRLVQQQKQIETYRAAGKKVPLAWITDPFWKRYYVFKGWSDPERNDSHKTPRP